MHKNYDAVLPPALAGGDQYGAIQVNAYAPTPIASSNEWLFIGAPGDDQVTADAGAVYVFRLKPGGWMFHQKLLATGSAPAGGAAQFGCSVAVDDQRLLVGAKNDALAGAANSLGVAYTFVFNGQVWVQEQRLLSFGPGNARDFGVAVAIEGDLVVVGARVHINEGVNGKGAAYTFRYNRSQWQPEQGLLSDVPSVVDYFGVTVALASGMILIGSPNNDDVGTNAGAVYVFAHDGRAWGQHSKLYAGDAGSFDNFGWSLSAEQETLVVGVPDAGAAGAAYVFNWNGAAWEAGPKLTPRNGVPFDGYGTSVSLRGDSLAIGAPQRMVDEEYAAGALYVLRRVNGSWIEQAQHRLFQPATEFWGYSPFDCWAHGYQPAIWPQSLANARLGTTVHWSSKGPLASSVTVRTRCGEIAWPDETGAVYQFGLNEPIEDCDSNGTPDLCQTKGDCNGNYVPDTCEVSETNADCNRNATPDDCEIETAYQMEDGSDPLAWCLGPAHGYADFIWLNQFRVQPGAQVITHVALSSSPLFPPGAPVTVMVYADPNDDGDPIDAALLVSAETHAVSSEAGTPTRLMTVAVPPTYVGEPGKVFFIGAIVRPPFLNESHHPWAVTMEASGTIAAKQRSWVAGAPPGSGDIVNLANNPWRLKLWSTQTFMPRPFMLRAVAADCNANGVWDACDIANGVLLDLDNNGIPDSCDVAPCFYADIYPTGVKGDGVVNIDDLLHVINNWGICFPCFTYCAGDTNDDCLINVNDLLTVINGWGPCP